jgi:MYXO-CTERM domain-containing protein
LDTDCPAHWTCATTGGGTTGSCSGGAERLPDGGFKELPPVCVDDPPTPTTKQCVPPNYGYSSDKGGSLGIPERGSFGVDAGVPIDTGSGSVPPATGSGTGTTGGPVIGQGRVVDDAPGDAPSSNESGGAKSASSDNGGCQIALGSPSTGAGTAAVSVMALLGLAGFARRRRTRWG